MNRLPSQVRGGVDAALRVPALRIAGLRSAARRGRGIALVWHRIGPDGPAAHEVVPTVATATFAAQLDLIAELGDIVPMAQLEAPGTSERPLFALSFDDDDPGHAGHTLPVLVARGLTATFFLSGRWRHGYGPYWWEVLEATIRARGADPVAASYGVAPGLDAPQIARVLTGTPQARELAEEGRRRTGAGMHQHDAAELAGAGMDIGFHTVDHPVLPLLDDEALAAAVRDGREELSSALGTPVERFAYPHGMADRRVSGVVAASGFSSAWTTNKRVNVAAQDPFLRGRWDVAHQSLDSMRAMIIRGLVRART